MSDNELDDVAGGTQSETRSLQKAIGQIYPVNGFRGNLNNPVTFYAYLPIGEIAPYLKKTYGIDAKIDVGEYDPGAKDFVTEGNANTYSRNGQTLTHQQVLDIIKGK